MSFACSFCNSNFTNITGLRRHSEVCASYKKLRLLPVGIYTTCVDNEKVSGIALTLKIKNPQDLVYHNKSRFPSLKSTTRFLKGTDIVVPATACMSDPYVNNRVTKQATTAPSSKVTKRKRENNASKVTITSAIKSKGNKSGLSMIPTKKKRKSSKKTSTGMNIRDKRRLIRMSKSLYDWVREDKDGEIFLKESKNMIEAAAAIKENSDNCLTLPPLEMYEKMRARLLYEQKMLLGSYVNNLIQALKRNCNNKKGIVRVLVDAEIATYLRDSFACKRKETILKLESEHMNFKKRDRSDLILSIPQKHLSYDGKKNEKSLPPVKVKKVKRRKQTKCSKSALLADG